MRLFTKTSMNILKKCYNVVIVSQDSHSPVPRRCERAST